MSRSSSRSLARIRTFALVATQPSSQKAGDGTHQPTSTSPTTASTGRACPAARRRNPVGRLGGHQAQPGQARPRAPGRRRSTRLLDARSSGWHGHRCRRLPTERPGFEIELGEEAGHHRHLLESPRSARPPGLRHERPPASGECQDVWTSRSRGSRRAHPRQRRSRAAHLVPLGCHRESSRSFGVSRRRKHGGSGPACERRRERARQRRRQRLRPMTRGAGVYQSFVGVLPAASPAARSTSCGCGLRDPEPRRARRRARRTRAPPRRARAYWSSMRVRRQSRNCVVRSSADARAGTRRVSRAAYGDRGVRSCARRSGADTRRLEDPLVSDSGRREPVL